MSNYTNTNGNGSGGEQGITLAFRVPTTMAVAIDVAAGAQGKNRSAFLREAVTNALATHSVNVMQPPEGATVYKQEDVTV